jgi:hypothetical protein
MADEAHVVALERFFRVDRFRVGHAGHRDVRTVAPVDDGRHVAVDDVLYRGPANLLRAGVVDTIVAIEVQIIAGDDRALGGFQVAAEAIELPLGNELVAIEQDAPVARAGLAGHALGQDVE